MCSARLIVAGNAGSTGRKFFCSPLIFFFTSANEVHRVAPVAATQLDKG